MRPTHLEKEKYDSLAAAPSGAEGSPAHLPPTSTFQGTKPSPGNTDLFSQLRDHNQNHMPPPLPLISIPGGRGEGEWLQKLGNAKKNLTEADRGRRGWE